MARTNLKDRLTKRSGFVVLAELTGGPDSVSIPSRSFSRRTGRMQAAIPTGFDFAAIALPQSPGGVANIEPASVIADCRAKGLLDGSMSCRT